MTKCCDIGAAVLIVINEPAIRLRQFNPSSATRKNKKETGDAHIRNESACVDRKAAEQTR